MKVEVVIGFLAGITFGYFFLLGVAYPSIIYVDKHSFNRKESGALEKPFHRLQRAIEKAHPGDVIQVSPGVYNPIHSVRHGHKEKRIQLIAKHRRKVVVQAKGRALDVKHSYHTFKGIVFDGGYGPRQVVRAKGADYLQLIDVEVKRGTPNCLVLGAIQHVLIENSEIHHCIKPFNPEENADSHGITGSSVFDLVIRDSQIYLVTGDAIQFSPSRSAWDDIRIEGSLLWSGKLDESVNGWAQGQRIGENAIDTKVGKSALNGKGKRPKIMVVDTTAFGWKGVISNQGVFNIKENVYAVFDRVTVYGSEIGFRLRSPALVRVQNAVIYDVEWGFRLEGGIRGSQVFNSTIGGEISRKPFIFKGGVPRNFVMKNVLFLNLSPPTFLQSHFSNRVVEEEAFVDAKGHNYQLRPSSPAINAGESLALVGMDRVGNPRPYGKQYDIGAFEWGLNK